jgi:DNA-directed RNA polymerase specialized sigma24 family protein
LSFPEIGARLGRSPDAVRKLWYRAFERLQAEMNDETSRDNQDPDVFTNGMVRVPK